MQLPREVIVGVNILDRVGEICTKLGFHGTALVVSGPVTYPLAGVGVAKSAAKAGCGDIVAKFSAVKDWQLAHKLKNEYYGDYAAELALMSAELVTRNVKEIVQRSKEGVRTVVEALISCGVAMSIAGSSRPCSGAEHLFSHALDIVAGETSLHGGRTGVGAIMCAYFHGSNWGSNRECLQEIGGPWSSKGL